MSSLAHDAMKWSILVEYRLPVQREVIAWADSEIQASDAPPASLLELSTTPVDHVPEMLSHLHILAAGIDFWVGFGAAMPRILQHLRNRPEDAERVATLMYRTAVDQGKVPAQFHFAYEFDDAFSLARDGVYGKPDEVLRQFMKQLAEFTPAA